MLENINYSLVNDKEKQTIIGGSGTALGVSIITAFGIVALITIVVYKLFSSKTGDITIPGGFKIKFTS